MADASVADTVPDPRSLARTYDLRGRDDPWDAVKEYQRVMRAAADHPDKKSHALSKVVNLPRSRIRAWVEDGGMPGPVRAIQTAETRGLLVRNLDTTAGAAFAGLVAWVFSGGSIRTDYYDPYFALNGTRPEQSQTDLQALAAVFDLDLRVNDREDGRATELVPTEDSSVLGRCLATAGAPVGNKTDTPLQIPPWIEGGPTRVQRAFAYVYITNRGAYGGQAGVLQIQESSRPKGFHRDLATLLETVAAAGTVTASADHVRADRPATEALTALREVELETVLGGEG